MFDTDIISDDDDDRIQHSKFKSFYSILVCSMSCECVSARARMCVCVVRVVLTISAHRCIDTAIRNRFKHNDVHVLDVTQR